MKSVTNKSLWLIGSMAGTWLMATVAFGNPAMLPDHPGHPMKPLKSPVTGQPLANDPGQEAATGQEALEAATSEGNQDQKLRSRSSLTKEDQNHMGGQNQTGKQGQVIENKNRQNQMGSQRQMSGQEHMTTQGSMDRQNQIRSQGQMGSGDSMERQNQDPGQFGGSNQGPGRD